MPSNSNGKSLELVAGRIGKCDCHRINCPCDDPYFPRELHAAPLAAQALLHKPVALIVDPLGRLYIADQVIIF